MTKLKEDTEDAVHQLRMAFKFMSCREVGKRLVVHCCRSKADFEAWSHSLEYNAATQEPFILVELPAGHDDLRGRIPYRFMDFDVVVHQHSEEM